jgi:hypothetical protein
MCARLPLPIRGDAATSLREARREFVTFELLPQPARSFSYFARHVLASPAPRAIGDVWFSSDVVTGNVPRMEVVGGRD